MIEGYKKLSKAGTGWVGVLGEGGCPGEKRGRKCMGIGNKGEAKPELR